MEDIVGEVTFQARSSPDVSQSSGVSVRMSIANYETLTASAVRRALKNGESEAVPRISDLASLDASTTGKIELEYAGVERSEAELLEGMVNRATRAVFEEQVTLEELRQVEDTAILAALELQREAGLEVFTDGEFRRGSFLTSFAESVEGFAPLPPRRSGRSPTPPGI